VPRLRPVDLDFVRTAPQRWAFERTIRAPRERVFAVVADVDSWKDWFPGFSSGRYEGTPGVGARRFIRYQGTTIDETMLAWDEPSRWTFRVDRATVPLAKALVEEWTFDQDGDGTLVRWTFASEPNLLMRLVAALQRRTMERVFDRAMRNLAQRCV
jgi:uncharacterized protein YndB with AHSA1/START domain